MAKLNQFLQTRSSYISSQCIKMHLFPYKEQYISLKKCAGNNVIFSAAALYELVSIYILIHVLILGAKIDAAL